MIENYTSFALNVPGLLGDTEYSSKENFFKVKREQTKASPGQPDCFTFELVPLQNASAYTDSFSLSVTTDRSSQGLLEEIEKFNHAKHVAEVIYKNTQESLPSGYSIALATVLNHKQSDHESAVHCLCFNIKRDYYPLYDSSGKFVCKGGGKEECIVIQLAPPNNSHMYID